MRKAFTLIELLVVVAIVSLISSVVMSSLNAARAKGAIGAGLQFAANIEHAAGDYAVGMWDFDECSPSTIITDRSGNGNNGVVNTATWSTDTPNNRGCSLSFSGSGQYALVPDATSMNFTGDMTMSAWIKPTTYGGGSYRTYLAKRGGFGTNYELFLNQAEGALSWYNGSLYISTYLPPLNQWTHTAGVLSNGTLTLYANGRRVYSTTGVSTSGNSGNSFAIGAINGGGESYAGLIDGVRVYSKSLTASEVQDLYAEGRPKDLSYSK